MSEDVTRDEMHSDNMTARILTSSCVRSAIFGSGTAAANVRNAMGVPSFSVTDVTSRLRLSSVLAIGSASQQ